MEKSKYEPYLEEYKASGMSKRSFCNERQINYEGFSAFCRKQESQSESVAIIKPDINDEKEDEPKEMRFRVIVGGMSLEATAASKRDLEIMLEAMNDVQKRRKA